PSPGTLSASGVSPSAPSPCRVQLPLDFRGERLNDVALATGQARPELRSHGPTVIAARQIRRPNASVGRGPPNSQDVLALQSSRDLWLSGTRFAPSQCQTGPCFRYSRMR